jgi:cell division protein ZapA
MAQVSLTIGGNSYDVSCRDGEEGHLNRLAAIVNNKAIEATAAVGNASEPRKLLFAALLLADELIESQNKQPAPTIQNNVDFDRLADRLEKLADKLENC